MRGRATSLPLAAALSLVACGGSGPSRPPPAWSSAGPGLRGAASGLPAERWFPLVDGHLYQYRTRADGAEDGMLVARVVRSTARVGELRTPAGTRRFEYREDGLHVLRDGAWVPVFRLPMDASTWRGEHGGQARWDATDVSATTPAGAFTGCARLVEERGGDRPARFETTFCPDVGVVSLTASSGAAEERAELSYVGPPLDLGPEGTTRLP